MVFALFIFLDLYEKPKKKLRKYTSFVLPDVKIQICPLFFLLFLQKIQKIQKSKTSQDFPKSFVFFDFWILLHNPRIQKSKNFQDFPKSFGFLDVWISLKIVCLLFAI